MPVDDRVPQPAIGNGVCAHSGERARLRIAPAAYAGRRALDINNDGARVDDELAYLVGTTAPSVVALHRVGTHITAPRSSSPPATAPTRSRLKLFVIVDIFRRYVVGWTVAAAETGEPRRSVQRRHPHHPRQQGAHHGRCDG